MRESPALEIITKLEEEKAILSYYGLYIPEFIHNGKEYKSLEKITKDEIRSKDIIVITIAHSNVTYDFVVKHAKAMFNTHNIVKSKNENVEKL